MEGAVDYVHFVFADFRGSVGGAVVDPRVVPHGRVGGSSVDDFWGEGAVTFEVIGAGFAPRREALGDVAELGYIFDDHGDAEGADDFHLGTR